MLEAKNTINKLLVNGYKRKKIIGEKGTCVVFQTGLIHRANIGIDNHRDVLSLECRPTHFKIKNHKEYFLNEKFSQKNFDKQIKFKF